MPFSEPPAAESAWIAVVDDWWNWEWYGNLIYSVSDRDGAMCVNRCAECERLRREYERATEQHVSAGELVQLGSKYLSDDSGTLNEFRRSEGDARKRLESARVALDKHEAMHKAEDYPRGR